VEFSVGGDAPILNPSIDQIEAGLRSLAGDGDSFAILAQSQMTYIQTSGSPTSGFGLEYQVESLDQHFRSSSHELPLHTVVEAFRLYASSDERWRDVASWERDDISSSSSAPLGTMIAATLILGSIAVWWLCAA
jgi:hypothetical protein